MTTRRTNTTTHFYREPRALELVRDAVVVPRAKAGTPTVWSVGCSSGDEPYTLALLAAEANVSVQVLGTDVNPDVLARAARGVYSPRNLRHLSTVRRLRWFREAGEDVAVSDELKARVSFSLHDVTSAPPPRRGGFDAVLCRNVLVYFTRAQVAVAVRTMAEALRPGGLMVLGAAEWLGTELRAGLADLVTPRVRDGLVVYERHASGLPAPVQGPVPAPVPTPGRTVPFTLSRPSEPARPVPSPRPRGQVTELRDAGDGCFDAADFRGARERFTEALALDPLIPDLHLRVAMCDVELEDPASASSAIRRALFIDPNLWPAWLLLGQLSELDDPMLASTCFSRALTVLEVSGSRRGGALAPFEEGREMAREALRQRLGRR